MTISNPRVRVVEDDGKYSLVFSRWDCTSETGYSKEEAVSLVSMIQEKIHTMDKMMEVARQPMLFEEGVEDEQEEIIHSEQGMGN